MKQIISLILLLTFFTGCRKREEIKITEVSSIEVLLKLDRASDCNKYGCDYIFRNQQEQIVKTGLPNLENVINVILKGEHKFKFTVTSITSDEGKKSDCITKIQNDKGILLEENVPIRGDIFWHYHCNPFEYRKSEESDLDLAIKDFKNKIAPVVDQVKSWIKD